MKRLEQPERETDGLEPQEAKVRAAARANRHLKPRKAKKTKVAKLLRRSEASNPILK